MSTIYLEFVVKFKNTRRLQNRIGLCNLAIKFSGDFAEFYRGVNEALLCESSGFNSSVALYKQGASAPK